ncbi:hypothetical protein J6590_006036 [Homalodisca vitripennis]|nr:hypothetical protein J6590_006036 [Homalodisca vitripennis]
MQDASTSSTLTVLETSQNVIVNPSPSKSFPAGSFESILLTKIKRSAPQVRKRKRVDAESKVITSEEWIEAEKFSREQAAEKGMNKCQKRKSKAEKTVKIDDSDESDSNLSIGENSDDSLQDYLTNMKQESVEAVEYQTPIF